MNNKATADSCQLYWIFHFWFCQELWHYRPHVAVEWVAASVKNPGEDDRGMILPRKREATKSGHQDFLSTWMIIFLFENSSKNFIFLFCCFVTVFLSFQSSWIYFTWFLGLYGGACQVEFTTCGSNCLHYPLLLNLCINRLTDLCCNRNIKNI